MKEDKKEAQSATVQIFCCALQICIFQEGRKEFEERDKELVESRPTL